MTGFKHPRPWLSIVGIGEDGRAGLSPAAAAVVAGAELLVGGARHLALIPLGTGRAERMSWPSPLADAIPALLAWRGRRVVVLASGDPFFYGIGATLGRSVPAEQMAVWPAPSAFSLAAARLGWALQDCSLLSLHGRPLELAAPRIQPDAKLLALAWDGRTAPALADLLVRMGFGPSEITVLERMGGPDERRRSASADAFDLPDIAALNTLAVRVRPGPGARPIPLASGLPDHLFEHDGQLTKREVRAVTLSSLQPLRGQLLWDIGLGAGSVAIEWMLADPANRAVGIEAEPARAARAAANALALGVPGLEVVTGSAPEALAGLDRPDAVFLGGGAGDAGVFEAAWAALRPCGRLVANAVTLESENLLAGWLLRYGGELTRLAIDRLVGVGSLHGWRPAMPVTQWSVTKPCRLP